MPVPSYIARVVLHYVEGSEQYTEFRALMKSFGFKRSIYRPNADGVKKHYKLPNGLYFFDGTIPTNMILGGSYNLRTVYERITQAVEIVTQHKGKEMEESNEPPSVFVTGCDSEVMFAGLKVAPFRSR